MRNNLIDLLITSIEQIFYQIRTLVHTNETDKNLLSLHSFYEDINQTIINQITII